MFDDSHLTILIKEKERLCFSFLNVHKMKSIKKEHLKKSFAFKVFLFAKNLARIYFCFLSIYILVVLIYCKSQNIQFNCTFIL